MADMVSVTRAEFFAYVGTRDVMPNHQHPEHTTWETKGREVVGKTLPGWRDGGDPNAHKTWMLRRDLLHGGKHG